MSPRPNRRSSGTADPRTDAKVVETAELAQRGRLEQAIANIQRILERAPAHAEGHRLASALLVLHNQPARALFHAERAVKLDQDNPRSQLRLGVALSALHRYEESYNALELARKMTPDDPEVLHALGAVAIDLGRYGIGEAAYQRAIELRPDWVDPAIALAVCELNTARAQAAGQRLSAVVSRNPTHLPATGQLALASSYDDSLSPEQVFKRHQVYGQCVERAVQTFNKHPNTPDADRRIRLGFLSSELRTHSITYFLRPLLEHIDHKQFEVVMYHASRHEDGVTDVIKSMADQWVVCDSLNPPMLAKRIFQDRIDVLVELSGHFARNRLPTFAARPAPVQVTAIGYGNTTGVRAINTRIVDAITDPSPDADRLATESLRRLDRCFLAYRPDDCAPIPTAGEPDRPFTFGSFNDAKKISPSVVKTWGQILKATPGSRLLLKSREFGHREMCSMIEERFAGQGVDAVRLTLLGRIESEHGHLALYDEIDVSLDTFPYAGTTTTCQSMWQGVPMLTLKGRSHAGRVGASLLNACGLNDWVAENASEYVKKACDAFMNGVRSAEDRSSLRAKMSGSPLLDSRSFSLATQEVYRELWTAWCRKENKA